jgi:predicted nuclease of predicted toxin-antitoxin system
VRVLFDQGTPVPLRQSLTQHQVSTTHERGWSRLRNGELLDAAEREGFELLVTTDSNLRHQQDLSARRLAIVVLRSTSWPRIQRALAAVVAAVSAAKPGGYTEVEIP